MSAQNLSGVLTQGSPSSDQWVSTFTIGTSNDGINFNVITDPQNQPIVYLSNQDRNTIARNYFPKVRSACLAFIKSIDDKKGTFDDFI